MLQSTSHHRYNFLNSSTWIVVERAFGRLKGDIVRCSNLLTLPSTIQACCILHNMLMDLANEREDVVCQIDVNDPLLDNPFVPEPGGEVKDTPEGIQMRESTREYLDVQGLTD
ncbi:hypothetical protein L7F22_039497 [Adiantum nelumboides]|nr:hypothetical protein [Adiantum nelumboides]